MPRGGKVAPVGGNSVCLPGPAGNHTGMATAPLVRSKSRRLWTYAELRVARPETNQPTELWHGEIIRAPAPSPGHQEVLANLWLQFHEFVEARNLGKVYLSPIDVVLSERRGVQPDLIFIARGNRGIVQDCIRGVPDLALEVVSESSWHRDRLEKKALYEQYGIKEYWLVDPDRRTLEVFALVKGAYRLHAKATTAQTARSRLLSGLTVTWPRMTS